MGPAFPKSFGKPSSNRSVRDPTSSPPTPPAPGSASHSSAGSPRCTAVARGSRSAKAVAHRSACSFRPGRPRGPSASPDGIRRTIGRRGNFGRRSSGGRLDSIDRCPARTTTPANDASTSRSCRRAAGRRCRSHGPRGCTQAAVAEGAPGIGSEPRRAHVDHARPRPAHRLRRGDVPEHRRMLGGARGDVPHPGRSVHAPLRLLRRDDGASRPGGRGRARADRVRGAADGPSVRRPHRRRARRPPGRRSSDLGHHDPRGPRGAVPGAASRCCPPTSRAASATSPP